VERAVRVVDRLGERPAESGLRRLDLDADRRRPAGVSQPRAREEDAVDPGILVVAVRAVRQVVAADLGERAIDETRGGEAAIELRAGTSPAGAAVPPVELGAS